MYKCPPIALHFNGNNPNVILTEISIYLNSIVFELQSYIFLVYMMHVRAMAFVCTLIQIHVFPSLRTEMICNIG